jgi:hypothetical protein
MGNHEYYGTNITHELKRNATYYKDECKDTPNLIYLQDTWVTIGDTAFFGSTYWTEFDIFDRKMNAEAMNASAKDFSDFQWITNGFTNGHYDDPILGLMPLEKKFTPRDAQLMHRNSKQLIKHFIKEHEGMKRVVITHHAPSTKSIHPKYANDLFNSCFASNDEDIMGTGIDLWIHGHMHSNFEYAVEDTKVFCNPRGYSKYDENVYGFIDDLVVEI